MRLAHLIAVRLLLVEDDPRLLEVLGRGLREAGYHLDATASVEEARAFLGAYDYAVAVVDWNLPGTPGVELVSWMRRSGMHTPVILLTARDAPSDRISGLDSGADDYLVKPFDFGELLARLRALMRRGTAGGEPELRIGTLVLDPSGHRVTSDTVEIVLSPREYAILEILMRRSPKVVHRSLIAGHAWPEEAEALSSNTIDVHIARLRAKLASAQVRVETVRKVGYRLVPAGR